MIRRSTNELSIRPKMAARTKSIIFIAVAVVAIAGLYASYFYGVYSSTAQIGEDGSKIEVLENEIVELRRELDEASEGLIFAERQKQIQEEAYRQLSAAYANSEEKNRVLGSTVDFYRSIISPPDNQVGPAVQALDARLLDGRVEFDVTLVQAIKHKSQIRGQLRVQAYLNDQVIGVWPSATGRSVSYQYFTKVSGVIEDSRLLPELAAQLRILVTLDLVEDESVTKWFNYE